MIRRLSITAALVVALVAGCAGSDDQGDAGTSSSTQLTLLPTTTLPAATTLPTTSTTSTTTTLPATTTTAAPETTTTTVDPAVAALVLSGEGIGSAEFGSEPEAVIAYVSSFVGEPTNDSGWIDPLSVGACPGTEIRFVDWGTLSLVFGDASQVMQGRRHFFAYYYGSAGEIGGSPAGLATERGITSGSRVIDVIGAYPGVSINPEDDVSAPFFYVNDNLRGFVTGVEDDSTVTVILGGIGCSE
jgi:hypothetical protein